MCLQFAVNQSWAFHPSINFSEPLIVHQSSLIDFEIWAHTLSATYYTYMLYISMSAAASLYAKEVLIDFSSK